MGLNVVPEIKKEKKKILASILALQIGKFVPFFLDSIYIH